MYYSLLLLIIYTGYMVYHRHICGPLLTEMSLWGVGLYSFKIHIKPLSDSLTDKQTETHKLLDNSGMGTTETEYVKNGRKPV